MVVDVGSGEGDFLQRVVQRTGCRGLGIDIQPQLVQAASKRAHEAGLEGKLTYRVCDGAWQPALRAHRATLRQVADMNEDDTWTHDATVVFLYLVPRALNAAKLTAALRRFLHGHPGRRVVTAHYHLEGWRCVRHDGRADVNVYDRSSVGERP